MRARRRLIAGAACALLVLMAATMLTVIARKSITTDEFLLIPAGFYHLRGNFELIHEHPPLVKILAALPLLSLDLARIPPRQIPDPPATPAYRWAHNFWDSNARVVDAISFRARLGPIALTLALAGLVFAFGRRLFGARAALLALALFSLEPTVLAHGRVVQTDIPAAFGFLLVFYVMALYFARPGPLGAAGLGLAAAIAILGKFSMLFAPPIVAAAIALRAWQARGDLGWHAVKAAAGHMLVAAVAGLLLIDAAYGFRHPPLLPADVAWIAQAFPDWAAAVTALSLLLPTELLLGVFWQASHHAEGHPASLLGMYSLRGWWYYFPVAFAFKASLPFLALTLAGLSWGAYRAWRGDRRLLFLLIPVAVYTGFVLFSHINIGVRYYLPAFPFFCLLGGALLDRCLRRRVAVRVLAVAALVWVGVEAARAYPDHMSYMNALAAPRPHWYYLSDSNVEWGDDIRGLAEYLRARGDTRVRAAAFGASHTLHLYGIEQVSLIAPEAPSPPLPRYAAIGASFLNGSPVPGWRPVGGRYLSEAERVNLFDAYRRRRPEAIIGGSIYVFRD
jgi:4-amino-4-deoxy-L-arabinose transferase-like glycosyltransferase